LVASFKIASLITKAKKKPHTIGEDLVLPAAIKFFETVQFPLTP
jgi:hypothetical protein